MNEKEVILSWNEAVELYRADPTDLSRVRQAVDKLKALISSNPQQGVSKLCYNVAMLYRMLGQRSTDLEYLDMCLSKDPHNAMAYYQRAIVQYSLCRYIESAKDFQKCTECMRQATVIDYSQLGLKCKLYQHEAIYNEGACHLQLGNRKNCVYALLEVKGLINKDSSGSLSTLDVSGPIESVRNGVNNIELIVRGEDKLYTPPISKLNNLAKKNYLGKAKVVSSVQAGDTFAGFVGPKLRELERLKKAPPDRPSSPRPTTPTPQMVESSEGTTSTSTQNKAVLDELLANQKSLNLSDRPVTPDYPPPKRQIKPSPTPRSDSGAGGKQSTPSNGARLPGIAVNGGGTGVPPSLYTKPNKPAAGPKPAMCDIELIAGEVMEGVTLPANTNYLKLIDSVGRAMGYDEGTFSLWYLNRQGTYTAIHNQEVTEHVWKWKVKDNRFTIYVFGV